MFFVFALVAVGASPLFALLALMIGLEISGLTATTQSLPGYPFLLSFMGIYAGLLALTLHFGLHRNNRSLAAATWRSASLRGLFYNLRTSYLPIVVGCYLIFVLFIFLEAAKGRPRLAMLQHRWYRPGGISRRNGIVLPGLRLPAHPCWGDGQPHAPRCCPPAGALLALPENELSKREGIRWSDPVGLDLARRVDPGVSYMGPTYERSLRTYYFSLWSRYPREMVEHLPREVASFDGGQLRIRRCQHERVGEASCRSDPVRWIRSGFHRTVFRAHDRRDLFRTEVHGPGAGMLAATVAATGFCITIESAVIMPYFYVQYHNAQLFALFLTNLVFFQVIVNTAFRVFVGRSPAGSGVGQ